MSKMCANCGAELENADVFCDECGAKQPIEQAPSQANYQQPQQSSVPMNVSQNYEPISQYNNTGNTYSVAKKISKMGIVSLIMGIISICSCGVLFIPELLGIIFGAISLNDKNTDNGFPIAGLVCSIVGFVIFIVAIILAYLME